MHLVQQARVPDVTLVNTVPSAARELVAATAPPATFQMVNLAGEALPGQLVDDLCATGRATGGAVGLGAVRT